MIEQHMARISAIRFWYRPALPFDPGRATGQSVEIRVNLKPALVTFAHGNLERLVAGGSAKLSAQQRGSRLDCRSIACMARRASLKVDDVEVRSRSVLHDSRNLRLVVVVEAGNPHCPRLDLHRLRLRHDRRPAGG